MLKTRLVGLYVVLALGAANAHEEHCHVKDATGRIVDAKDAKTKAACDAKGGVWRDHHFHCHKAGADGKLADFPDGKDKKSCETKGGTWSDHGHDTTP